MSAQPHVPVFDIGGVLIDWDPRHLYRKIFTDTDRMEWFLSEICTPDWNESIDAGRTFDDAISDRIAAWPDWATEIVAWRDRWPEMVAGPIHGTVDLLERLQSRGPVFAITNFGAESIDWAIRDYPFLSRFDGMIVSGRVGMIKPDPAIYQALLDTHGLDPASCFFIDDRADNVEAARDVGFHAVRFQDPETLETDLASHGLL